MNLGQVVGGHVGGHAHGDACGAVQQQVGEQRWEVGGLGGLAVVGRSEAHRVLVELADHGHGGLAEPALGVAGGGRRVVQRTEVALRVDQGHAPGE